MQHQNFVCFKQAIVEFLHALAQTLRPLVECVEAAEDGGRVVAASGECRMPGGQGKVGRLCGSLRFELQLLAILSAIRRNMRRIRPLLSLLEGTQGGRHA